MQNKTNNKTNIAMSETSLRSRFAFSIYLLVAVFLLCELVVRVFFAFEVSPRIMLYGTDWYRNNVPDAQERRNRMTAQDERVRKINESQLQLEAREDSVEKHHNKVSAYSKFYPNEIKTTRDVDTGERIPTTINKSGFRGKDFAVDKAPGVVRIVTLGASSTFGFYNRDQDTYPYQLQSLLDARCPERKFEVINLGIPHLTSDMIAALYLAEGAPLQPDVVTFYEGRNDSVLNERYGKGLGTKVRSVLINRSLFVAFADQALFGSRESVTSAGQAFEPYARVRSEFFLGNLDKIRRATLKSGAKFILVSQQAAASPGGPILEADRLLRKGVPLSVEAEGIRKRLAAGEEVFSFEYSLLVHERMMQDAEAWAAKVGIEHVDVVEALDQNRHYLLSWVHLHPEANKVVASSIAVPILKTYCPQTATN